jgi:hypothetical protein
LALFVKNKPRRPSAGAFSVREASLRPQREQNGESRFWALVKRTIRTAAQMLYGATIYEMVRDVEKERGQREKLFILLVFGDLLGVPVLPSFYTLRLLPYVACSFDGWRTNLSRPRDLTDMCNQELM